MHVGAGAVNTTLTEFDCKLVAVRETKERTPTSIGTGAAQAAAQKFIFQAVKSADLGHI